MIRFTPKLLHTMVEQPEPSTEGDWYIVDIDSLTGTGVRYVAFHFRDGYADDSEPDAICAYGEDDE